MDSRVLPIPQVCQLDRPFCLYACTSMTLRYFGIDKSMQDVANEVFLPMTGDFARFTEMASTLRDYFRDHGLEAKFYRDQEWDDLKANIEKGNAIIAFVKYNPGDWNPDHAWVLRGFDQTDEQNVIYNDPWRDPGDDDPVTFDFDEDGFPGETMRYDTFLSDRWKCSFPPKNQSCLVVSYPGQGMGHDYDWRTAGSKNYFRFLYHTLRLTRGAHFPTNLIELFFEAVMASIAFVGYLLGVLQTIGQGLEAGGKWLINKGKELIGKGGVGNTIGGCALVGFGAAVAAVGYFVDFVTGVGGTVIEGVTNVLDWIGSIFSGSDGGSTSKKLGDTNINLGLLLNVEPWRSRWGDNWEEISGSWTVAVEDFSSVDELKVWWKIKVWGWGIDDWSLSHSILESSGTIVHDTLAFDGNHHKHFYLEMANAQGIRMSFGKDRCHYGLDGGMTRVQLEVEVRATLNGESVTLSRSDAVYGLST